MKATFPLQVVSTAGIVFNGNVESVYLFGTEGEFELLPFHFPLMASLVRSEIGIAGYDPLPIETGIVMFRENSCTIVARMQREYNKPIEAWS